MTRRRLPWTLAEDCDLVSLYLGGASVAEVSAQMQRPPNAIHNRIAVLRGTSAWRGASHSPARLPTIVDARDIGRVLDVHAATVRRRLFTGGMVPKRHALRLWAGHEWAMVAATFESWLASDHALPVCWSTVVGARYRLLRYEASTGHILWTTQTLAKADGYTREGIKYRAQVGKYETVQALAPSAKATLYIVERNPTAERRREWTRLTLRHKSGAPMRPGDSYQDAVRVW